MSDQTIFCVAPAGFDDTPRHAFIEFASRRCSREVTAAARNRPPCILHALDTGYRERSGPCRSASSLAMVKACLDAGGCRAHDRCGGVGTLKGQIPHGRSNPPWRRRFRSPASAVRERIRVLAVPASPVAASRTISTIGCPADGLFPIEALLAQDLTYHRVPITLGLFQTLTVCNAAERFSQRVHG